MLPRRTLLPGPWVTVPLRANLLQLGQVGPIRRGTVIYCWGFVLRAGYAQNQVRWDSKCSAKITERRAFSSWERFFGTAPEGYEVALTSRVSS
jgi:hypothetical protein